MVGIILLELGVYELNYLLKVTEMAFQTFLQERLYPTLILNLAFTILVSFPLKRQFEKYAEELRNE
jgi:rod shape-determining protein MreD